jgi:hypothetical protein
VEHTKLEEQQRTTTTTLITAYKEGMQELCQEVEQIIEAERGGNTTFEQSMQVRLTNSAVKLQRLVLETDLQQFKTNQLGELTGQQTNSLLGQMKEKMGRLVEQQSGFFGNMLPKLLEQRNSRPLLLQNLERQEIADDTNQQKNSGPTKEPNTNQQKNSGPTKDPNKTSGVFPEVTHESRETPEAHEQCQTNIFFPKKLYVRNDCDRESVFIDILLCEYGKGNMIIYVNPTSGEQRLNNLVNLLHGEGFDRRVTTQDDFTTSFNPTILADKWTRRQILIVTRDDVDRVMTSRVSGLHDFCQENTTIVYYDNPKNIHDYKWSLTEGMLGYIQKSKIRYHVQDLT